MSAAVCVGAVLCAGADVRVGAGVCVHAAVCVARAVCVVPVVCTAAVVVCVGSGVTEAFEGAVGEGVAVLPILPVLGIALGCTGAGVGVAGAAVDADGLERVGVDGGDVGVSVGTVWRAGFWAGPAQATPESEATRATIEMSSATSHCVALKAGPRLGLGFVCIGL